MPSLLGHLTPSTRTSALLARITGAREPCISRIGDEAPIGHFAAANEFLGEAAAVEGLGGGVNGVGNDVGFRGEQEEGGDEVVDFKNNLLVKGNDRARGKGTVRERLTWDTGMEALTQGTFSPLLEFVICVLLI